jgi:hypothetical protein
MLTKASGGMQRYMATGIGTQMLRRGSGSVSFLTAPSGTAGSAASFTERLTILNGGGVGIGTTSLSGGSTLDVNGTIHVGLFASSSATTVCQNGNILSTCSSARRYKENVQPSQLGLKEVLAMKPVTFDFTNHKDNWEKHNFGFIAEDMKEINPLFVTCDDHGEINGVRYMQLTVNTLSLTSQDVRFD